MKPTKCTLLLPVLPGPCNKVTPSGIQNMGETIPIAFLGKMAIQLHHICIMEGQNLLPGFPPQLLVGRGLCFKLQHLYKSRPIP